jgi:hypothetical protein
LRDRMENADVVRAAANNMAMQDLRMSIVREISRQDLCRS